jgi:hypothetical protein
MSETSWLRPKWAPWFPLIRRQCPSCTSVKFKAAELRPYDGLLALFWLRPGRCLFCWRRFAARSTGGLRLPCITGA